MLLAPRFLPRLAATVGLFTRYGLRDLAARHGLQAIVPEEFEVPENEASQIAERATAFRKRLVELGPAYIKLGQVLSTRPDLIPEPYIRELEHLQDDVGAIPLAEVESVIEQQLGARISKLFSSFDPDPLGTASLGQVHGAQLRDGRNVVVKVQRPGIRDPLAADMEFFREFAKFLTDHTEAGERIDMLGVVQQLERALADELDYRIEARNAMSFRRSLASFPHLLIPRIIEAYTAERVLTSERIYGVKIDAVPSVARIEHDFTILADEFAKGYLKQITIDGHFHADPHPGNVFIVLPGRDNPSTPAELVASNRRAEERPATTPLSKIEQQARRDVETAPPDDAVRLALIDFGMTAHLSNSLREGIVRLLLDLADNRGDAAAETLVHLGQPTENFDRAAYVRDISSLVSRNYDRAVGEIKAGTLIYEMLNASYQRGLVLPAELTLLAKALFNLDAVCRALDPTYAPFAAVKEYGNRIATERAKSEMSMSRLYQVVTQTTDLLNNLPRRIDQITAKMAANEFAFRLDTPQLPLLLQGLQKVANRIFSGLVLCGLFVASAMLLNVHPALGTTGFVIAAAIGLWMVVSIIVTDRNHTPKK